MATTVRTSEEPEHSCALRALNICDTNSAERAAGGLGPCHCDMETLCEQVGWLGAAKSHREERSRELAAWVLHPSRKS